MTKLPALAALALVAAAVTGFSAAGSSDAAAASPNCKTSVGSGNKWTCTTDFTAGRKSGAKRTNRKARYGTRFLPSRSKSASTRFKAKTIPCYQSQVPGCR